MHEARYHEQSCFLTLTYNDQYLPSDMSLNRIHGQKFIRRLRKSIPGKNIRYIFAGEYGENHDLTTLDTLGRPHFHMILFGHDFEDKTQWNPTLHRSEELERLWPFGFSTIGEVTRDSAAYVARYCCKKISGEQAEKHYQTHDRLTGEIVNRTPEYLTASNRRPNNEPGPGGIGYKWFYEYHQDLRKGYLTDKGQKKAVPKYYLKLLEFQDYPALEQIREKGRTARNLTDLEQTPGRQRVREQCKIKQTKSLARNSL